MKIKILFICIFLALAFSGITQDYIIKVSELKPEISLGNYYIDSVFSINPDSVYVGRVNTGLNNRIRAVKMETSIAADFNKLFIRLGLTKESGEPVTLRINRFYIGEAHPGLTDISFIILNVSFLQRKNGEWYEVFQGISSLEKSVELDATSMHGRNIENAIEKIFRDFRLREKQGKLRCYSLNKEDLEKDPNSGWTNYYIFRKGIAPKALYHSFYDLRDGFPDTITRFSTKSKVYNDWQCIVSALLNVNPPPMFYSEDNHLFVKHLDHYFLVERGDNDLIPKCIPDDSGYRKEISLLTGEMEFEGLYESLRIRANSVFCLSNTTEEGLYVTINDGLPHKIERGQFWEIEKNKPGDVKLTFTSNKGQKTEEIIKMRLFYEDLYVIRLSDNGIKLVSVEGDLKKSILNHKTSETTVQ